MAGVVFAGCSAAEVDRYCCNAPPATDVCAMLAQELPLLDSAGPRRLTPFLSGNTLNYLGGQSGPDWTTAEQEEETLGFTHAYSWDGRARGQALGRTDFGVGADMWGWEFYRKTRIAYGTAIVNGRRIANPPPARIEWRPDRLTLQYDLGSGVRLSEVKWITLDDVLVTSINASVPIEIEFSGRSFWNAAKIPTDDGDQPRTFSRSTRSTCEHVKAGELEVIHVVEKGTAMSKAIDCSDKRSHNISRNCRAQEAPMMYSGMSALLASSSSMSSLNISGSGGPAPATYSFRMAVGPSAPTFLAFAMDDESSEGLQRIQAALSQPQASLHAKTTATNAFLTGQITSFRGSDAAAVKTYYYAYSLYYMYLMRTPEGAAHNQYEHFRHTQTAVNNFQVRRATCSLYCGCLLPADQS